MRLPIRLHWLRLPILGRLRHLRLLPVLRNRLSISLCLLRLRRLGYWLLRLSILRTRLCTILRWLRHRCLLPVLGSWLLLTVVRRRRLRRLAVLRLSVRGLIGHRISLSCLLLLGLNSRMRKTMNRHFVAILVAIDDVQISDMLRERP